MRRTDSWSAYLLNIFGPLFGLLGLGYLLQRQWRLFVLCGCLSLLFWSWAIFIAINVARTFDAGVPGGMAILAGLAVVYVATWAVSSFHLGRSSLYAGTDGDHTTLAWGMLSVGVISFVLPLLPFYQLFVVERTVLTHPVGYAVAAGSAVLLATLPGMAAAYEHGQRKGRRVLIRYAVAFVLPLVGFLGSGSAWARRPIKGLVIFLMGLSFVGIIAWHLATQARIYDLYPEQMSQLALHAYVLLWSYDLVVAVGADSHPAARRGEVVAPPDITGEPIRSA